MNNNRFLVKTAPKKHIIKSQSTRGNDNMNKILKMLIKEAIHNNVLIHTKMNTGDRYTIFNKNGDEVLSVNNGWATNNYDVSVDQRKILSVRWDESKSKPLSKEQKDMLDIINACKEKIDLQETAQTMTPMELQMANFLQNSLCTTQSK